MKCLPILLRHGGKLRRGLSHGFGPVSKRHLPNHLLLQTGKSLFSRKLRQKIGDLDRTRLRKFTADGELIYRRIQ